MRTRLDCGENIYIDAASARTFIYPNKMDMPGPIG
jgi:hypothetical protein